MENVKIGQTVWYGEPPIELVVKNEITKRELFRLEDKDGNPYTAYYFELSETKEDALDRTKSKLFDELKNSVGRNSADLIDDYISVCFEIYDEKINKILKVMITANPTFGDIEGAKANNMEATTIRVENGYENIVDLAAKLIKRKIIGLECLLDECK